MPNIEYISKSYGSFKNPWMEFGAPSEEEYKKWSPEVCGICCIKMAGDTYGTTLEKSIYQLTMECEQKGGFKKSLTGKVLGVFHQSLLDLGKNYGLDGEVNTDLNSGEIIASLKDEKFVILSVNKSKINLKMKGGHLILIHEYNPETEEFLINDPEPILAENGENVCISLNRLELISNKKGLIVWKGGQGHGK
jgi:hypothetical protein